MPRIYLDNSATSFPKPDAVYAAVDRWQREIGVAVGRGATRTGGEVQRVVDHCRLQAARFFGAQRPEQVLFTFNGTDSLNLAIQGILKPGDRAITTVWDHNSVLRPLRELQSRGIIQTEIIPDNTQGTIDLDALRKSLKTPTRLVVITHASNVTGVIQPVEDVVELAQAAGALVLLDAAQTAGHLPIDLQQLPVDLMACPGHKGLMGPLGTGLLILAPGREQHLQPVRFGGTGTTSESDRQPLALPERYESGNHNAPGLFGLAAALDWWLSHSDRQAEQQRIAQLIAGLQQLPGLRLYHVEQSLRRVGTVSFTMDRMTPQVAAALLDEHFQIETRAGLHCAPLAHAALGTLEHGGTVRISVGPFTTAEEIDTTLESLAQIVMAI